MITTQTSSPTLRLNGGIKIVMLCGGLLTSLAMIGITAVLPQIEADLARSAQDKMLVKLLVTGLVLAVVVAAVGLTEERASRRVANTSAKSETLRGWFPFRYAFLGVVIGVISYVTMVYIPAHPQ